MDRERRHVAIVGRPGATNPIARKRYDKLQQHHLKALQEVKSVTDNKVRCEVVVVTIEWMNGALCWDGVCFTH
jgi:hypothetical protein